MVDDSRHKRLKVGRACHPCRMKKIKCKARRRKCMYLKNPDETYIRLDPVEETLSSANTMSNTEPSRRQSTPSQHGFQPQQPSSASSASSPPASLASSTPLCSQTQHPPHHHQQQQQQQQPSHHNAFNGIPKIYATDQPDHLFSSSPSPQQAQFSSSTLNEPPSTRSDKMIEQLTDGIVRLTLNPNATGTSSTSSGGGGSLHLDHEHVTPWPRYGDIVRWTPEPHLPIYYTASIDMPSRAMQEQLLALFFDECQHILPILSRTMFYDQLKAKGPLITPLLLNSMYAHAAHHIHQNSHHHHHHHHSRDAVPDGDLFYHRARRLVDDFLDTPRISTVIALLYMALYDCDHIPASGSRIRSSRAWLYSGMAIRMCFELGLHTANYSSQMSQCDIELRKRVLWTCFVMDKLESCTMERPWMLRSSDIAVDFPQPLPEDTPSERLVLEGFNQLCRLMTLVEKVIHFFTHDLKKNLSLWTVQEENQIVHYLDAIHQWRNALPQELQWETSLLHSNGVMAAPTATTTPAVTTTTTTTTTTTNNNNNHPTKTNTSSSPSTTTTTTTDAIPTTADAPYPDRLPLPDQPMIPSSAVVVNLHLIAYDLELSLLMCCRYQDEDTHREKRRTLANTITRIVALTVQHPHLMYNFSVSTFSGIFAALTHAVDFDDPRQDVSASAKVHFRKSLDDVRLIVERIPMRDLRHFARLVDLLQPTMPLLPASLQQQQQQQQQQPLAFVSSNTAHMAFSAITDVCHHLHQPKGLGTTPSSSSYPPPPCPPPPHQEPAQTTPSSTTSSPGYLTPDGLNYQPNHNPMISGQFAFDYYQQLPHMQQQQQQQQSSSSTTLSHYPSTSLHTHANLCSPSSPSSAFSSAAAAVAAAAAAVGAVDTSTAFTSSSSVVTTPLPSVLSSQSTTSHGSGGDHPGTGTAAAAAATTGHSRSSIEPADYTFELISVADEWARSLMYQ
ncbi:fungal-specific transcription factor domain-containing protein [Mycotypha africana]|uniref:fungal-specific transcription factor domain-containing protein n=1 Tax=Mycotypha africana TaxID=64632 RepID=UPI002300697C|nr:fungal-specific transcription factor domain-containing protein [Mycotypha africana]KAI8967267.1 fungal-specific transcription factor domain-containing protein [Mycotypha africana]